MRKTVIKMFIKFFAFVLFLILEINAQQEVVCQATPQNLKKFEKACKEETFDFLEKVQSQASGLLNKAKKLVGVASEENKEQKKCEYYMCVFKKMEVLTLLEIPDSSALLQWVEYNTEADYRNDMIKQTNRCFNKLYNNLKSGSYFDGSYEANTKDIGDVKLDAMDVRLSDLKANQSTCDLDKQFMMCLNGHMKCAVFNYP